MLGLLLLALLTLLSALSGLAAPTGPRPRDDKSFFSLRWRVRSEANSWQYLGAKGTQFVIINNPEGHARQGDLPFEMRFFTDAGAHDALTASIRPVGADHCLHGDAASASASLAPCPGDAHMPASYLWDHEFDASGTVVRLRLAGSNMCLARGGAAASDGVDGDVRLAACKDGDREQAWTLW